MLTYGKANIYSHFCKKQVPLKIKDISSFNHPYVDKLHKIFFVHIMKVDRVQTAI